MQAKADFDSRIAEFSARLQPLRIAYKPHPSIPHVLLLIEGDELPDGYVLTPDAIGIGAPFDSWTRRVAEILRTVAIYA
jgi:hypothetical protein